MPKPEEVEIVLDYIQHQQPIGGRSQASKKRRGEIAMMRGSGKWTKKKRIKFFALRWIRKFSLCWDINFSKIIPDRANSSAAFIIRRCGSSNWRNKKLLHLVIHPCNLFFDVKLLIFHHKNWQPARDGMEYAEIARSSALAFSFFFAWVV